ncbi:kti12, chromatin associated [Knufia obscura]|uniref:Kti12, chromatin associated n=2 Tax=Knufia TaxID=430999 RepID=A0AAN8ETM3_9EURO|nr:kti12, chromatin associated [Knufia obscura]KAK5958527.1 kti12, chromatin associated [Knufia fluminis]
MPLVIITGTPCSGKTYRAQQIASDFEARINASSNDSKRSVLYLPSHHASLDPPAKDNTSYEPPSPSLNPRDTIYDSARLEKIARAEEFSTVKRAVDKNVVVVADAPNYIKGFRYQLFCEAKAAGTRSIVVHTAAREDECVAWNDARLEAWDRKTVSAVEDNWKESVTGPKVGKDVLGGLQPESHTAIYGDTVLDEGPRSRSSSVGAAASDDDQEQDSGRRQKEDTMTLKSLYISDHNESLALPTQKKSTALESIQEQSATTKCTSYPPPFSNPPHPKTSLPYSPTSFKSLFMRYEPPSPFSRWDTPLFTIPSTDAHPPYDAIWAAIFPAAAKSTSKKALQKQRHEEEHARKVQRDAEAHALAQTNSIHANGDSATPATKKEETEVVRQHAATILPTATAPNALQVLESTTGEVVKLVLASARSAGAAEGDGGTISMNIPIPDEEALEIEMEVPEGLGLSQPALQRLRRKYTQIQRGGIAHGQGYTQGRRNVAESFVQFLQAEWDNSI